MMRAIRFCVMKMGKNEDPVMPEVDWSDLQLFFHVASEGGLAGASSITGISAPTIGRRMLALERSMGRTLFIRSQQGYRLAADGMVLYEHVQTIRRTTADITRWHGDAFTLPIVSIAGDTWMTGFIAENTRNLRGPADSFRLCCKQLQPGEDLTYRHGMIALFPTAPKTGNVAVRKSVDVAYAIYRAADLAMFWRKACPGCRSARRSPCPTPKNGCSATMNSISTPGRTRPTCSHG
jgi:hypothetical protein